MTVPGPMTPQQTRLIDPILSNYALGYAQPQFVGALLFPRVPVQLTGGQILSFGKESFMQYATRRAWGGKTARASFGYSGDHYALVEDAIEVPLPRELARDASVVPGIDLATNAVRMGMDIIGLSLERDQAALALNPANYDDDHQITLSGTSQWSNAACDPVPQINAGREAVRGTIGQYPNVMNLSAVAFNALRDNAAMRAHFQYTTAASITEDMLAAYFGFEKVAVGRAVTADDAGNLIDIWGDNAVMARVQIGTPAAPLPSYGYTYTMLGHPLVEQPYWDPTTKSWVYGTTMERAPVITATMGAAYLIINPS